MGARPGWSSITTPPTVEVPRFTSSHYPAKAVWVMAGAAPSTASATGRARHKLRRVTCLNDLMTQVENGKIAITGTNIPNGTVIASSTKTGTAVLSQAGTGTTSGTFTKGNNVTNAAYRACVALCMTSFALTGSDTNSLPFYDFKDDVIYVGGDNGLLYRYTGYST